MNYFSKGRIIGSALSALLVFSGLSPAIAQVSPSQPEAPAAPAIACGQSPNLSGVWEVSEFKLTENKVSKTYKVTLDRYGNGTCEGGGEIKTQGLSSRDWKANWSRPDQDGGFVLRFSDNYQKAAGSWWPTRIGKENFAPRWVLYRYKWKRLTSPAPTAANFPDLAKLKTIEQVSADINATAAALTDRGAVPE